MTSIFVTGIEAFYAFRKALLKPMMANIMYPIYGEWNYVWCERYFNSENKIFSTMAIWKITKKNSMFKLTLHEGYT